MREIVNIRNEAKSSRRWRKSLKIKAFFDSIVW